jgi:hypothetical protein
MEIVHYKYPIPFTLIKNFMSSEKHAQIKSELKSLEPNLEEVNKTGGATNDNGQFVVKRKGIFLKEFPHLNVNSGITAIYDKTVADSLVERLAPEQWHWAYFKTAHTYSTLISRYTDGDEYDYHRDASTLSTIYYVFDGTFDGGHFFFGEVQVPIEDNSMIVFPSCYPHAVKTLRGPGVRWSITNFIGLKNIYDKDEEFARIDNLHRFPNFCNPEEWSYVLNKTAKTPKWQLSGSSSNKSDASSFWYMDLNDDEFFTKHMFSKIPQGPWKLQRVYANGHSYGQDGELHQDSKEPNCWTFLLYATDLTPERVNKFRGETEFLFDRYSILQRPHPNHGILFNSTIEHRGLSPCRYADNLRVTIAWKLEKI